MLRCFLCIDSAWHLLSLGICGLVFKNLFEKILATIPANIFLPFCIPGTLISHLSHDMLVSVDPRTSSRGTELCSSLGLRLDYSG